MTRNTKKRANKTKHLCVRLDDANFNRLTRLAKASRRTYTSLIEESLEEFLQKPMSQAA